MISSVLRFALILLVAAVLAVSARALFVARAQQPEAPPPPDVRVRMAAIDLPAGLLLRDGDLDWRAFPANRVPKDALREGTPQAELGGALMRRKVAAGTVLAPTDFMRSDAPGFLAAVLQPGMRAVSVPIDDVSGNAGLIQPGDAVDMILTQRLNRDQHPDDNRSRGSVVSETVVENARIIAVGSSFQTQSSGEFKPVRARTVTLEVDPKAAEAVTVAAELGSLSLALRSFALDRDEEALPGDEHASVVAWRKDAEAVQPVWGEDVSHALRATRLAAPVADAPPADAGANTPPPSEPAAPRHIRVMRGQDTEEHTFTPSAGRP